MEKIAPFWLFAIAIFQFWSRIPIHNGLIQTLSTIFVRKKLEYKSYQHLLLLTRFYEMILILPISALFLGIEVILKFKSLV